VVVAAAKSPAKSSKSSKGSEDRLDRRVVSKQWDQKCRARTRDGDKPKVAKVM
jgi:hypothetical protein